MIEFPVASLQVGGRRIPAGGGGYLRLLPVSLFRRAIRQLNRAGQPAVLYMHPYELAPEEFAELPVQVPWRMRLQQGLGRRALGRRLTRLLGEFRFSPLGDLPETLNLLPTVNWPNLSDSTDPENVSSPAQRTTRLLTSGEEDPIRYSQESPHPI
jgi:hypothetical protein